MTFSITVPDEYLSLSRHELESIGPQLIGDMAIGDGVGLDGAPSLLLTLEELADTPVLFGKLQEMADSGIRVRLGADW